MKQIYPGGLMRCCTGTLLDHINAGGSEDEGALVDCRYCAGGARVINGAWRWKDDPTLKVVVP